MINSNKKQVFVSYRRGSGLYMAKNIATYLSSKGYEVFFDYDSIENGVFDQQIFNAIENSNDFILVLTENALDNCTDSEDWVRAEVMCAKKHNKNIILATDAERFKTYPENLPKELQFLKKIDWTPIHPKLFEGSMKILTNRLKSRSKNRNFLYVGIAILAALLLSCAVYLYYPTGMTSANLGDDEDFPVNILSDYDYEDSALFDYFENTLGDEMEVILAQSSSTDKNCQMFIVFEDLNEINAAEHNISEEQLELYVKTISELSVREYYIQVKKGIMANDPTLKEDLTPFTYDRGGTTWIFYRFYNSNAENEIWKMSCHLFEALYANVTLTAGQMNYFQEMRFKIKLKRMLDEITPVLLKYARNEYS